jgi:hypothetical protein
MKKVTAKPGRKAKQTMSVVRMPAYVLEVARGVAEFSGVPVEDTLKVIFCLGLAWGQIAEKQREPAKV